MSLKWLPGATVVDLTGKYGYRTIELWGVCHHVNEGNTSDAWFRDNPGDVCPNFQVYKDGSIHQYRPMDARPSTQAKGNGNYAGVENAGYATEPLTDAQLEANAKILAAYHTEYGVPLQRAHRAGERGYIGHVEGASEWSPGGHTCPGPIRLRQLDDIVARAQALVDGTPPKENDMDINDPDEQKALRSQIRQALSEGNVAPYGGNYAQILNAILNYETKAFALLSEQTLPKVVAAVTAAVQTALGKAGGSVDTAALSSVVRDAMTEVLREGVDA